MGKIESKKFKYVGFDIEKNEGFMKDDQNAFAAGLFTKVQRCSSQKYQGPRDLSFFS
jgi:hypothetical protein